VCGEAFGGIYLVEGIATVSGEYSLWMTVRPTPKRNNYCTEMCSGSEEGSYLRLLDFLYHSSLGLRVIKKRKKNPRPVHLHPHPQYSTLVLNPKSDTRNTKPSTLNP